MNIKTCIGIGLGLFYSYSAFANCPNLPDDGNYREIRHELNSITAGSLQVVIEFPNLRTIPCRTSRILKHFEFDLRERPEPEQIFMKVLDQGGNVLHEFLGNGVILVHEYGVSLDKVNFNLFDHGISHFDKGGQSNEPYVAYKNKGRLPATVVYRE